MSADHTVSMQTAMDIALAHREIETGEKLLAEIAAVLARPESQDVRDAFGRPTGGLQLGVPVAVASLRLFNVPWRLARPIIEMHIAEQKSLLAVLSAKARAEADAPISTPDI